MELTIITNEQAKQSSRKEYNESAWIREVDSYLKYKDVVYYMDDYGDDVYEQRCFVGYTIPEGIRFFAEITYSDCLSSAPFKRVDITKISQYDFDYISIGKQFEAGEITKEQAVEKLNLLYNEVGKKFYVSFGLFYHEPSNQNIAIPNTPEGRRVMAQKSAHGVMFTNQF